MAAWQKLHDAFGDIRHLEGFMPDMDFGELYKYAIETQSGDTIFKADPYAFSAELRPGTASKTADIDSASSGSDEAWLKDKSRNKDTYTSAAGNL
jgi:1,4-alpha-glucan branching enzyme